MADANVTIRLNYVGPGASTVAPSVGIVAPFDASVSGQIDIPDATADATVFPIPFGTITSATVVAIKNESGQDVGIRLNGAVADEFQLPDGGMFVYAAPAEAGATPIDEVDVVTTAAQSGDGKVDFWILGDPVAVP